MSGQPPQSPPRRSPHSPPGAPASRTPAWNRVVFPGLHWTPLQPPTPKKLAVTRRWLAHQTDWGSAELRDFIACRWFEMRANGVEDVELQFNRICADVRPRGGTEHDVLGNLRFMHRHWRGGSCDA